MNIPENYKEINKDAWNKRTDVHVTSEFYDVDAFLKGNNTLHKTDLALLGDIRGKSILHLQCHFGMDSLSMARMGAKVTGIDLSDHSIAEARKLNDQLGLDAEFICCDIYDAAQYLEGQFDIVFTSYGVIGWLPDLKKWGHIVQHFLKPKGTFILIEFHPVVWMFDSKFTKIEYSYFNQEAIVDETTGTYTDRAAAINYKEVSWNHSLDEVFNGLAENGISVKGFREYAFSHYNCFSDLQLVGEHQYKIIGLEDKLPMMYSIVGIK
jgi:2-polyprenyl-3-methyl-5-hydroxy-6-metoxy-1,4-benzoquinol methylase